jgi:hypothetical protein
VPPLLGVYGPVRQYRTVVANADLSIALAFEEGPKVYAAIDGHNFAERATIFPSGKVYSVCANPDLSVVIVLQIAASDGVDRVWKSLDYGFSWTVTTMWSSATPNESWGWGAQLSCSADLQVIFGIWSHRGHLSTDGGASWRDPTGLPGYHPFGTSVSADGNRIVACSADDGAGCWVSVDRGASFTGISAVSYAVTQQKPWDSVIAEDNSKAFVVIALSANAPVWRVAGNDFQTWTRLNVDAAAFQVWCDRNCNTVVAEAGGQRKISFDGGDSWTLVSSSWGSCYNKAWTKAVFSADSRKMLVVTWDGGVCINWTPSPSPTPTTSPSSSVSPSQSEAASITPSATVSPSVSASTSALPPLSAAAMTLTTYGPVRYYTQHAANGDFSQIVALVDRSNKLFAATDGKNFAERSTIFTSGGWADDMCATTDLSIILMSQIGRSGSDQIWKSTDIGYTWSLKYDIGVANEFVKLYCSADLQVIWAIWQRRGHLPTDGGLSWSDPPGVPSYNTFGTTVSADGNRIIACSADEGAGCWVSNDRGASFTFITSVSYGATQWKIWDSAIATDNSRAFAVIALQSNAPLYRVTGSNFETWTQLTPRGGWFCVWCDTNCNTVVIEGGPRLISFDGGDNWVAPAANWGSCYNKAWTKVLFSANGRKAIVFTADAGVCTTY